MSNHMIAAIKVGITKRLKKIGLSDLALVKALAAVEGHTPGTSTVLKLSPAVRKQLKEHVHQHGPIVISGRKSLKVYSLECYDNMRKASRYNATKRQLWECAATRRKTFKIKLKKSAA